MKDKTEFISSSFVYKFLASHDRLILAFDGLKYFSNLARKMGYIARQGLNKINSCVYN